VDICKLVASWSCAPILKELCEDSNTHPAGAEHRQDICLYYALKKFTADVEAVHVLDVF